MEKRMSVGQYAFYYGVTTGFALALISLLSYVPVLGTIAWLLQQTYQDAGIDIPDQTIRDVIKIVPYVVGIFYILGHLVVGAIFGAIYSSSFRRDAPYPPEGQPMN